MTASLAAVLLVMVGLLGCDGPKDSHESDDATPAIATLGPADGRDLPGVDLDRVRVGDAAPNFSLASLAGPVVTLSDFRGRKNVILVFYRGYW